MSKLKVALIEFNNFHFNVLKSLYQSLEAENVEAHCFLNAKYAEQHSDIPEDLKSFFRVERSFFGSLLYNSSSYSQIGKIINSEDFSHVIFNTLRPKDFTEFVEASGVHADISLLGIVHDSRLIPKVGQRIDHFFTLSEHISIPNDYEQIHSVLPPSFNPIDYRPNKNSLSIAVVGKLEKGRKDLEFLVEFLVMNRPEFPLKFIMLGDASSDEADEFVHLVYSTDTQEYFEFYDYFIPDSVLLEKLSQCDLIMPLIHDRNEDLELYSEYKSSGSFLMMKEFAVPGLIDECWKDNEMFRGEAIFYEPERLFNMLKALSEDKGLLMQFRQNLLNKGAKNQEDRKRSLISALQSTKAR